MTKSEKRVLRSSSIRARRSERNKNTSKRKTTSRSARLHFQKQEKALEEAKKRKKGISQIDKSNTKDSTSATNVEKEKTSVSESCSNNGRPVRVATRKALESIGKVSRYESQIDDMIGSIASYSGNDDDDDFNIEFSDIDTLEYDSTHIRPPSPHVPILPPPPKYYYHPSTHNRRIFELTNKASEEKEKPGSVDMNGSIHSYLTDDETTESEFLPLTILRQSRVPKPPSPLKLTNHPTSHDKGNSALAIPNNVGGSDNTDDHSIESDMLPLTKFRQRFHSKRTYPEDYSIDSDSLPLSRLKQRRYKNRNEELGIGNKDKVGGSNVNVWNHSKRSMNPDDHSIDSDLLLPLTILKAKLQRNNSYLPAIRTTTHVKIHSMADIYRSFDLPKTANTNIPSIADRNERSQLNIHNPRKWNGLVNVSLKCISTLLQILCPGPSRYELVETITQRLSRAIEDKKRSEVLLVNHDVNDVDDTLVCGTSNEKKVDYESIVNKLLHNMFTILKESKNASIEKRVVRAIIARSLKRGMLTKNCNKYGVPDLSVGKVTKQIKQDFDKLMNGEQIIKKEQTRAKISDNVIDDVVSYILHRDHIFTMSWGDRSYKLSDSEDVIVLPCLCRKQSPLHLWRTYQSTGDNIRTKVGRSTFYSIVRDLTVPSRNIAKSIDYVQALLVSEPIELLQEVVEMFVPIPSQDIYRDYLTSVSNFLKNTYQKHAVKCNDDCVTHDLNYILGRVSDYDDTTQTCSKSGITCTQCKFPFYVSSKIKEEINRAENSNNSMNDDEFQEMKTDATKVVNDCVEKSSSTWVTKQGVQIKIEQ